MGTYNRRGLLERAVGSVRRYLPDAEIVVCDGGSTDGSISWLRAQPDVVLIEQGRLLGGVAAFNACFRAARGDVLLTLNDDVQLCADPPLSALGNDVGQIAFRFKRKRGRGREQTDLSTICPDRPYANFGAIRRDVAIEVADICGGLWNPCYFTYGGDTELSAWVHRLGYDVFVSPEVCVIDYQHEDALRQINHENKRAHRDGARFWMRWSGSWPPKRQVVTQSLRPHGPPPPGITESERLRLEVCEKR